MVDDPVKVDVLDLRQQLRSSEASVDFVIGATGAGFANQMFLRPGSKVVVISCSACFPGNLAENLMLLGKPHDASCPYFGLHVLHYLVDIPFQSLKWIARGGIAQGSLGMYLPDVQHFWAVVIAFFREVEENAYEYLEDEDEGPKNGSWASRKRPKKEREERSQQAFIAARAAHKASTLLCDSNTVDLRLVCRKAGVAHRFSSVFSVDKETASTKRVPSEEKFLKNNGVLPKSEKWMPFDLQEDRAVVSALSNDIVRWAEVLLTEERHGRVFIPTHSCHPVVVIIRRTRSLLGYVEIL